MSAQQRHYVNGYVIALAANATAQGTPIEMPRDGYDVSIEQLSVSVLSAAGVADTSVPVTLQLTDLGGTNQTFFVHPQIARNLVGDGQLPWLLPVPWRVSGSARLGCEVRNLTANAYTVHITVQGRRLKPGE